MLFCNLSIKMGTERMAKLDVTMQMTLTNFKTNKQIWIIFGWQSVRDFSEDSVTQKSIYIWGYAIWDYKFNWKET